MKQQFTETASRSAGIQLPETEPRKRREAMRFDVMQEYWAPSTRLLMGSAGCALATLGIARRGITGMALGLIGGAMLARSMTNIPTRRLVGLGAGPKAVDVQKTINIHTPIARVFEFFASYNSFPRFMANVREVRVSEIGRSHWIVAGPAGMDIEWDAEITQFIPNKVIAWRTVPGSTVENAGIIRFDQNPDDSTRVDIKMSYNPPAGALGHAMAMAFGTDPKSEMDADLARVKTALETGHPPHDAARPIPRI